MSTETSATKTGFRLFEKGPGFASSLRDLRKHTNGATLSSAIISTIFGCTGPCLVTIAAGQQAGFSTAEIVSWVFGIYVFGGLLGVIMSLYYKMPISGAFSIPGASMVGAALMGYSFQEAAGAFFLAGVIVLILGITGLIGKVMRWLPLPIVMGMIGGCMLRFGTGIITGVSTMPLVCGLAVAAFLITPRISKKIPGVLAALVVGAENAQAMGVLKVQGYDVPANGMTVSSGIGGMIAGMFGALNANVAGPMTAICSSDASGPKEGRYAASVWNGLTFALFGVLGSFAIAFVTYIPSSLISVLAGLAMINVLIQSFSDGFGTLKYKTGAFFALVVGASGISILGIGSAFWALVAGVVVSAICDSQDFKADAAVAAKN